MTAPAAPPTGRTADDARPAYMSLTGAPTTVLFRAHDDPAPPARGGKSGRIFSEFTFARAIKGLI